MKVRERTLQRTFGLCLEDVEVLSLVSTVIIIRH
jgi:hypothetical protein